MLPLEELVMEMRDRERIINAVLIGMTFGSLVYAALVIAFH